MSNMLPSITCSTLLFSLSLLLLLLPTTTAFFPEDWQEAHFGSSGISHETQTRTIYERLAQRHFPGTFPLTSSMTAARDRIILANEKVDDEQESSAKHFDGENFAGGQARLVELKREVVRYLREGDEEAAQARLGAALHTLQDFYAHSNWIELGREGTCEALGREGGELEVAGWNETTCVPCEPASRLFGESVNCSENTAGFGKLTSGYYHGQDVPPEGVEIPSYKCHHGGAMDNILGPIWGAVCGEITPGINKDSNNFFWSPHYQQHEKAAELAMEATEMYMEDIIAQLSEDEVKLLFGVTWGPEGFSNSSVP